MSTIMMRRRRLLLAAGGAAVLATLGGLQRAHGYQANGVKNGARITGTVRFTGTPPAADAILISKDGHVCGEGSVDPNPLTVSNTGALKDAVVALRGVESGKPWGAAGSAPHIVQADCRFEPYVQVARKGAALTITNRDPLLHNIHAYEQIGRARRTLFNIAQPAAGQVDTAALRLRRGWVVEIDCDAHNWMSAWVATADHPYLVVTGADGRFALEDVPSGQYELVTWHPLLGERARAVALSTGEGIDLSLDLNS